jgi:hypothetical protein
MMKRACFFKKIALASGIILAAPMLNAASAWIPEEKKETAQRLGNILQQLRTNKQNVIRLALQNKRYKRDADKHFPHPDGVRDRENGYRFFFHAHRPGEYGHFHTFADLPEDNYAHLIMISMNKHGMPIMLSTLNKWVTDEKVLDGKQLKEFAAGFTVNENLIAQGILPAFIKAIFTEFQKEIHTLLDERDMVLNDYRVKNGKEIDEDDNFEILSYYMIDPKRLV